jgi:chitinase
MPAGSYTLACAPSGVGCLGGITNDDPGSPYAYAQRNTLTGEDDTNLYNATIPTNGISLFGFTATGHMIPVIDSVGSLIDLIAIQNYNVGASTNRLIMYDSYAYYADTYGFDIAAGLHFPDEAWGPHFEYTPAIGADIADHINSKNVLSSRIDGVYIWQALLSDANSSAYSYLNIASQVLNGYSTVVALANADNWSLDTYGGTVTLSCTPEGDTFCGAPEYDISLNYPTQGTQVHYDCTLWTNNWWANPGEYPGLTPGQWTQGSACAEGPGCQ